ncbi:MAG: RNase adapter RapZ [Pseudomonadota bacterium]
MRLIVVSGRSGSGKTTALQVLEDTGFYCVDNLPVALLPQLAAEIGRDDSARLARVAVGIDARNVPGQLERFPQILRDIATEMTLAEGGECEVMYLDANDDTLLKRFAATRRKHPLSSGTVSLAEAMENERTLLEPIATLADLVIDTSQLTVHGLRDLVRERVVGKSHKGMGLLFESFGFKHGVPPDADIVFDVRCLPNPYWIAHLRQHTGLEQPVIEFLDGHAEVQDMISDLSAMLDKWLPRFEQNDRQYMTVAVGCTGGYHRSVYVVEQLARKLEGVAAHVQIRHRELADSSGKKEQAP